MKIRIASIDIFRALTMLLMIFVNDLWTLNNIPGWLEHKEAHEDGLGLADVVFPAFLFIVGISIPYAVKARLSKGESPVRIFFHILRRSLALIVMGFYMVNQTSLSSEMPQLTRTLWQVCMVIAFILIWNDYGKQKFGGIPVRILQGTGIVLLILLAVFFKGGTAENPEHMSPQWWGILGIIGWAYLVCATIYLIIMNKEWAIPLVWVMLFLLNILEFLPSTNSIFRNILIVGAANHALVGSGLLGAQLLILAREHKYKMLLALLFVIPAILLFTFGFATRPVWGISKIMGTPSWSAICAGICFISFALIYIVADILRFTRWSAPVMPAGTNTLTCYLLPVLLYPVLWPLQQMLPDQVFTGMTGLIKSFLFSLFIIWMAGLAERFRIKLKI